MPTTEVDRIRVCTTAGEAWAAFLAQALDVVGSSGRDWAALGWTWAMSSRHGYRVIEFTYTQPPGDEITHYCYLMLDLRDTDLIDLRNLLSQSAAGMNSVGGVPFKPYPSYAFGWWTDEFLHDFVPARRTFLDTLTAASSLEHMTVSAESIIGNVKDTRWVDAYHDSGDVLVDVISFREYFWDASLTPAETGTAIAPPPNPQTSSMVVQDASAIVSAINEITNQDIEVGINDNSAVYSVKAKVVAS